MDQYKQQLAQSTSKLLWLCCIDPKNKIVNGLKAESRSIEKITLNFFFQKAVI